MRKLKDVLVSLIDPDPEQPRKHFDESELLVLGQNMRAHGQHEPVIVYTVDNDVLLADEGARRYMLANGERRLRAAKLIGLEYLLALVLDKKPTPAELMLMQASIDYHRADLKPSERADTLERIQNEKGCTLTDAATQVGYKQSMGSKLLSLTKVSPEIRKMVDEGGLSIEAAYILSREPDHAKQLAMLPDAAKLSRAGLAKRVRGESPGDHEKLASAKFCMPGGYTISLRGAQFDLAGVVDVLSETVRILKKGLAQGLSLTSQVKVMADTAKAK